MVYDDTRVAKVGTGWCFFGPGHFLRELLTDAIVVVGQCVFSDSAGAFSLLYLPEQ